MADSGRVVHIRVCGPTRPLSTLFRTGVSAAARTFTARRKKIRERTTVQIYFSYNIEQ